MPKTFVLAPDSFKESMTALEACHAMKNGLEKIFPDAQFLLCPMADGGEGTVDALIDATQGEKITLEVTGPLKHQKIATYYGLIDQGKTAVIEMAKANGIHLLAPNERNPLHTSTFGTGEMIRHALDHGVNKIIIGLGGSVTNDAGMGMAAALGVKFLDQNSQQVELGGGYLDQIQNIDISHLDARLKEVEIIIASDVNNPLLGKNGATFTFGAQKGATPDMLAQLEHNLAHFSQIISTQLGRQVHQISGSGAAGGLAAGLLAFTDAKIQSGITTVIEQVGLEKMIEQADFVLTGEGAIDFQTQYGKTPIGVSLLAKKHNKPVIVCAGHVGEDIDILYDQGITAIFGILHQNGELESVLRDGTKNLTRTCENIGRLIALNF